MFDGPFLFFTSPALLAALLLLGQPGPETAVAELAIVIPERVPLDRVHFLQPQKSGPDKTRRQRSVPLQLEEGASRLLIRLPIGVGPHRTSDLYLMLHQDAQFLAPGFSVEEISQNQSSHQHQAVDQLCFYTGHVLNHSHDSFASLSTCGGLVGYIQIGLERVEIQPVSGTESSFNGKEHFIRHKRSSPAHPLKSAIPMEHCSVLAEKKKSPKVKLLHDWKERRNAIHLTNEYTVETLVVADADMVQYHGVDAAQRFILTVMNMVYNMFQHQSLGVKVNVRVTKLVLLRRRPAKLSIGHHGERSLESFCQWQNEEFGGAKYLGNNQVPGARDDTPPVDAAVFVTRTDFCVHKNEPCDTVGPYWEVLARISCCLG